MSDLIRREAVIAEVLAYLCSAPAHDEELLRWDMEQLIRALPAVQPGKEVMPNVSNDPTHQPDAAPAGNMTAGGGAGQMSDTPVVTGLVASNLTAGGGAEKMALCDAIRMGMGLLRVTHVDPDQMREDREEKAMLAREDDQ